ncbi:Trm112 family protein [Coxiella endosymbiont of Amblyomma sculptum]|uniref:Trm112 family protein n=1 Tax=Coxiella endosymbiont of Amblyomma sculptum TaxID=2487929 RepID=UPI00132E76A3|nr:Trm112 family protein [Coxiella endosymbiont of Amblyomma sculptum]QHG92365.1 Trm112 family protein [Coxiella endosymbiont of Amblyomma sculptum]
MDKQLLKILACPLCKGKLIFKQEMKELHCQFDQIAYSIQEGIPIMLSDRSRIL